MANYFNTLNLRQQLAQLGKCRFMGAMNLPMARATFRVKSGHRRMWRSGAEPGLNMRDSGLDIAYALRKEAIAENVLPGVKRPKTASKWGLTKS